MQATVWRADSSLHMSATPLVPISGLGGGSSPGLRSLSLGWPLALASLWSWRWNKGLSTPQLFSPGLHAQLPLHSASLPLGPPRPGSTSCSPCAPHNQGKAPHTAPKSPYLGCMWARCLSGVWDLWASNVALLKGSRGQSSPAHCTVAPGAGSPCPLLLLPAPLPLWGHRRAVSYSPHSAWKTRTLPPEPWDA